MTFRRTEQLSRVSSKWSGSTSAFRRGPVVVVVVVVFRRGPVVVVVVVVVVLA